VANASQEGTRVDRSGRLLGICVLTGSTLTNLQGLLDVGLCCERHCRKISYEALRRVWLLVAKFTQLDPANGFRPANPAGSWPSSSDFLEGRPEMTD
jgi:hypothetical protein